MTTAILLTCHGTVERAEDVPAFLANIRRGRPTPPAMIEEVTRRLDHIGGSPLMRITRAQAEALAQRVGLPVHVAGRLWGPYPNEVLPALVGAGVRTVVSLPLAPQSVDVYHGPVREAAAAHPGLELRCVPAWGTEPALVDAFAEAIDETLAASFPIERRASVGVVLTAHSLPNRVILAGDPYERQFREMASLVADRVSARGNPVRIAFQSQGMNDPPPGGRPGAAPRATEGWLGPDLSATFAELVAAGVREVLVSPIGFVADHVETLYDLDVEAPKIAAEAGVARLARAPAMNARPRFIDALEAVVRRELGA